MIVRLLAAVLASTVLCGPGSTGVVQYLCSMSGGRVLECCCKPSAAHRADHDHEAPTRVERQGCCALEISEGSRVPATVERVELVAAAPFAIPVAPDAVVAAALLRSERPHRARGPPLPQGPPLFVRNCSFLI